MGDRVKKVEGWRSTDWYLQNSHGDAKHSMGYIVNNAVKTVHGARWVLQISGGTFHKVCDCLTTML